MTTTHANLRNPLPTSHPRPLNLPPPHPRSPLLLVPPSMSSPFHQRQDGAPHPAKTADSYQVFLRACRVSFVLSLVFVSSEVACPLLLKQGVSDNGGASVVLHRVTSRFSCALGRLSHPYARFVEQCSPHQSAVQQERRIITTTGPRRTS